MIDIDFFKSFNDTYGHLAGDDCLKIVAKALDDNLKRAGDLLARYGGEEFAVLLPNTNDSGARIFAEKLREAVENLQICHEKSSVSNKITISLGGASILPGSGHSKRELINAADQALYRSKEKGRNQVTWSEFSD